MSTQDLASVTLKTIENYRAAAEKTVAAYRFGGHRLVGLVDGVIEKGVYTRTARIAPRTTDKMNALRGTVAGTVDKGIDEVADRAVKLVDLGGDTAAAQVAKMADLAAGVDNTVLANGLHTAAKMTLPGAKIALKLSTTVVRGAERLADAAGTPKARKATRAAVGKKRTKAVAEAVKPAARRVRKAVAEVAAVVEAAPAKKPRRARPAKAAEAAPAA
ncbi:MULTISPECIES: hypothetical protein [Rubrivivax]|uniref:Phasin family protein n=1 Tax=Rubrivivax benzoatilyticus TaxID=316997 RepID=A0ABX0I086_9BURK|nr:MULTISPECIES: hypothetical protein [Rubrivivax]EGJ12331.1 hypothetical protein RBXJA2T_18458 [Rubrivivax benzoatilyticus JA2 = ATCC BAA-35]NHK99238.1 hypothetical protein [Rubrivivax benzoatilyticus]NHL24899.1 hypothetical protein [Rubrivivax benzoatilyticus]